MNPLTILFMFFGFGIFGYIGFGDFKGIILGLLMALSILLTDFSLSNSEEKDANHGDKEK